MDPESFNRYRVRRRLGSGAFATVWLCVDPDLEALVAVKALNAHYTHDEDIKSRFVQEARILRRLDSDRILRVHTIDRLPDGRPYFVADYADAGNCEALIRSRATRSNGDRSFSLEEAVLLSRDLAQSLTVAHRQNIVHRDLKPSNILFRTRASLRGSAADGDERTAPLFDEIVRGDVRMVLADFGIARALEAASGHTIAAGTPHYMAPEQADGDADVRSDLYAASVIFYELLAGNTPFPYPSVVDVVRRQLTQGPPSIREIREDVPASVDEMLIRGMSIDPAQRFQTAEEWLRALDDLSSEIVVGKISEPDLHSTIVGDSRETLIDQRPPADQGDAPPPDRTDKSGSGDEKRVVLRFGDDGDAADSSSLASRPWVLGGIAALVLIALVAFLMTRGGPPPTPEAFAATASGATVELSWSAPAGDADLAEYRIYRNGELVGVVPADTTAFTDDEADVAEANDYQIEAVDSEERVSERSASVTVAAIPPPNPPAALAAVVNADSIELSWQPPDRVDELGGYGLYRNGDLIDTIDASEPSYSDRDADVSTSHEYHVDAFVTDEIRSSLSEAVTTQIFVVLLEPNDVPFEGEIAVAGEVDLYRLEAVEGEFITLFLTSEDHEVVVDVFDESGTSVNSARSDSVVLDIRIPQTGSYRIEVRLAEDATGSYTVNYGTVADLTVPGAGRGELEANTLQEWNFFAARGDLLAITLWPDTATGELTVLGPDVSETVTGTADVEPVTLILDVPQDGTYIIQASFTSGSGGYDLMALPLNEIVPRERFTGELSGTLDQGVSAFHPFIGIAGLHLFATMISGTGDSFMTLFDPIGEVVISNDDFAGDTLDAGVDLVLDQTGEYEMGVAFLDGTGSYSLIIDQDLPAGLAGITAGATIAVEGERDVYTFRADQDEIVLIQMVSVAGDSRLSVRDTDGELAFSDDAFGLDAQIGFVAPANGSYWIDADMVSGSGPYELFVTRIAP